MPGEWAISYPGTDLVFGDVSGIHLSTHPELGPVNASAPVRYAAPSPQVVITQQGGGREVHAPISATPAPGVDAETVGTLVGRQMGRYLTGMVV